jgi:hypothetical protein
MRLVELRHMPHPQAMMEYSIYVDGPLEENGDPCAPNAFSYRILIVEDDSHFAQVGKLLLESQGYEVLIAEDGFELDRA